jgi:hypothetical protein
MISLFHSHLILIHSHLNISQLKGETPELKDWEVETAASIILNFLKTANYEADDDLFKGPDSMATQFADANGMIIVISRG